MEPRVPGAPLGGLIWSWAALAARGAPPPPWRSRCERRGEKGATRWKEDDQGPLDEDQTAAVTQHTASLAWAGARKDRPNWAGLLPLLSREEKQRVFLFTKNSHPLEFCGTNGKEINHTKM